MRNSVFLGLICLWASVLPATDIHAEDPDSFSSHAKSLRKAVKEAAQYDVLKEQGFIPDDQLESYFDQKLMAFLEQNLYRQPHDFLGFLELHECFAQEDDLANSQTFVNDLNEAFQMIRKTSPALFQKIDGMNRIQLLQSVLDAVKAGVKHYEAVAEQMEKATEEKEKSVDKAPSLIVSNKLLYVRLNEITKERLNGTGKQDGLLAQLQSVSRLRNQPLGIILDLRGTSGTNYNAALDLLSVFCDPDRMRELRSPGIKRLFDLPIAILIDGKTSGNGEIVASLIEKFKQGITLGEATAGIPVTMERGEAAGYIWMIPQLPYSTMEAHAHSPMIPVNGSSQIERDKLVNWQDYATLDHCLSRAVDLLLSLDALKERKLIQSQRK